MEQSLSYVMSHHKFRLVRENGSPKIFTAKEKLKRLLMLHAGFVTTYSMEGSIHLILLRKGIRG